MRTPAIRADAPLGEVPVSFLNREDDGNPFRSPLAEGEVSDAPDEARTRAADELARRAWKSSIVGLFACPPLLHFYSIYLLLKIGGASDSLSRTGSRHYYGAFLVDALALLAVGISLKSLR